MSNPTADRAGLLARGLLNLRGQQKSIERELAWTQERIIVTRASGDTTYLTEYLTRASNLEDVLLVITVFIELGEQEQQRLLPQSALPGLESERVR